jgi:hypothetical protein
MIMVVIVAPPKVFPPFIVGAATKILMASMGVILPPAVINNFVVVP